MGNLFDPSQISHSQHKLHVLGFLDRVSGAKFTRFFERAVFYFFPKWALFGKSTVIDWLHCLSKKWDFWMLLLQRLEGVCWLEIMILLSLLTTLFNMWWAIQPMHIIASRCIGNSANLDTAKWYNCWFTCVKCLVVFFYMWYKWLVWNLGNFWYERSLLYELFV